MKVCLFLPGLLSILFFSIEPAGAHPVLFSSAQVYIQPDGGYQLFVTFDLMAFLLQKSSLEAGDPPMNALLDGPPDLLGKKLQEASAYFLANTKLQTDRGPVPVASFKFPALDFVQSWKASGRTPRLPVIGTAEMDGSLPATASQVQFKFPVCLGTVILSIDRPGDEFYAEPIIAGSMSNSVAIHLRPPAVPAPSAQEGPLNGSQRWLHCLEAANGLYLILGLFLVTIAALRLYRYVREKA